LFTFSQSIVFFVSQSLTVLYSQGNHQLHNSLLLTAYIMIHCISIAVFIFKITHSMPLMLLKKALKGRFPPWWWCSI